MRAQVTRPLESFTADASSGSVRLEGGAHVLCEKPITPTMAELDQVEAAAAANNVTIFEAFMYLHHPQTLKVKEMIESGKLYVAVALA